MIYFILFSISIILHELGHFAVAKCFGIHVKKFCIFFDLGFQLFSTGKRFSTEYCIGWLPFGGYVKFDAPEDGSPAQRCITVQKPWKRLAVSLAGVATNLLVAYFCVFAWIRVYVLPQPYISTTYVMERAGKWCVWELGNCCNAFAEAYLPGVTHDKDSLEHTEGDREEKQESASKGHGTKSCTESSDNTSSYAVETILLGLGITNLWLFLFNLLPIPPLDGAQSLFAMYEMVLRRSLNEKVKIVLCLEGALVLLAFMFLDGLALLRYL